MSVADRVLQVAQHEAPQFGFWKAESEAWPSDERPKRVLVTVEDQHDDEIEVVVDDDASDVEISTQVWNEINGRSEAAASVVAERASERSALACDR